MVKQLLHRFFETLWYGGSPLAALFAPLSWIVERVVYQRRQTYLKCARPSKPYRPVVVVVGNITAGGTGKTPLVVAMVHHLKGQGYRVGAVLRGYGSAQEEGARILDGSESSSLVGDEALLIHEATGVPVAVCRQRQKAVEAIAEHCDVVIADDGLQHYAMPRQLEIAVVDGQRCFGNGRLIPAGPLREPVARLSDVDMVVTNGGDCGLDAFGMSVEATGVVALNGTERRALVDFAGTPVYAIAGIGNPERFYTSLRNARLQIETRTFPDHHAFVSTDFEHQSQRPLLMTAKDAVKCRDLGLSNAWVVYAEAHLPDTFFEQLDARIERLLNDQ